MSESRPSAAVNAFKERLQRALSCITDDVLLVSQDGYAPSRPGAAPHSIIPAHDPSRLAGAAAVFFSVRYQYRVVRSTGRRAWLVQPAGYHYGLDDGDRREILAYHWHPETVPDVPFPHLHIGHGAVSAELLMRAGLPVSHNGLRPDLAATHLPMERIELEKVLLMVLQHFRVTPAAAHRNDWQQVLERSKG